MPGQLPIRLPLGLVNAYLLRGAGGDILIDTGMSGSAAGLCRLLAEHGSSPESLRLIIITHVHFDHVGGLAAVRARSRAPVLVHRAEASILRSGAVVLPAGQTPIARVLMCLEAPFARRARLPGGEPDLVMDDRRSLADFGLAGHLIHTPGHTTGSISLVLDSGDAVVGDLCQYGWGFGLGAGSVIPPLADAPAHLAASYDRLLAAGAVRIFPGHGRPFPADEVRRRLRALPAAYARRPLQDVAPGQGP